MSPNVEVRLLGIFREIMGTTSISMKLQQSATIFDVIQKLTEGQTTDVVRAFIDNSPNSRVCNALVLVNGKEISALNGLETAVYNGDKIVMIPIVHGGKRALDHIFRLPKATRKAPCLGHSYKPMCS